MSQDQDPGMLSPGWANVDTSVVDDRAWIVAALRTEAALATCQSRFGIIPTEAAAVIREVTATLQIDPASVALNMSQTSNPAIGIVQQLQRAVDAASPGTSDFTHLGATSQDILDTATMIVSAEALTELEARLGTVRSLLVGLIKQHGSLPMVGRTVSQHAVPMTFGAKASAWLNGIVDAELQVRGLLTRRLPLSLAGASGTLAAYQEFGRRATGESFDPFKLVTAVAQELDLDPYYQPWHTLRAPVAQLASCLAIVSGSLGKVATDIHLMTRTEIGEVSEELGEEGGVSTSMPQKRNPAKTVLVLAAARQVPALSLILMQAMVAEDERTVGAWQSEWQPLRDAFRLVLGSAVHMTELLSSLRVDGDNMLANLHRTGPGVIAEHLNIALTPLIGRLQAKEILHRLLPIALADPNGASAALRDALEALGVDTATMDFDDLLEPRSYLGASEEIARRALARSAALTRKV